MYIVPVSSADENALRSLIRRVFPRFYSRSSFHSNSDRVWIAKEKNRVIGVIRFSFLQNRIILNGLGVDQRFRNRGVATALLEEALHSIELASFPVYLKVSALNPAVGLYERFGFMLKKFGKTHTLVRLPKN